MEQPVFDITNFNFIILAFYLVLGFVVAQLYDKLPKENMWLLYVLVVLIVVAVWHETRIASRFWMIVSLAEMLIGGALSVAYLKIISKHSAPESNE